MLRIAVALAVVSFIYVYSPHRDDNAPGLGSVPGRLAQALPRPDAAEAALAGALLRGALDGVGPGIAEPPARPIAR